MFHVGGFGLRANTWGENQLDLGMQENPANYKTVLSESGLPFEVSEQTLPNETKTSTMKRTHHTKCSLAL